VSEAGEVGRGGPKIAGGKEHGAEGDNADEAMKDGCRSGVCGGEESALHRRAAGSPAMGLVCEA
jgi:hypothetical protein